MDMIRAQVRDLQPAIFRQFLQFPNIVACGLGYKVSEGKLTDQLSLVFSVVKKQPLSELSAKERLPGVLDGIVTDVVETGKIRALAPFDPRVRCRPAQPGISIAHKEVTAGTLGLLVRRGPDLLMMSNNHVLAAVNAAKVGDLIYQPGPADGGTLNDRLGTLAEFVPLDFGTQQGSNPVPGFFAQLANFLAALLGSKQRFQAVELTAGKNRMDVALARPDAPESVNPEIAGIGRPTGMLEPKLGLAVQKMGRTTGLTKGMVQQIDVTVTVDYQGRSATFVDQTMATRMSQPGDSGSAILDMDRKVVGLLFAGSDQVTMFTPMPHIVEKLGVQIVM